MPLDVIIWGAGGLGGLCIAAIRERPALRLVGVRAYSLQKHGLDSGLFCAGHPNGVIMTGDEADLLARPCDCVIYVPRHESFAETDGSLLKLLAAGRNVVTPLPYHHLDAHPDPDFRRKVEAACAAGESSLLATGVNPDVVSGRLLESMAALSLRVQRIRIHELWDCRDADPAMLAAFGFGQPLMEAAGSAASTAGSIHFLRAICAAAQRRFQLPVVATRFERTFLPAADDPTRVAAIVHRLEGVGAVEDPPLISASSAWCADPRLTLHPFEHGEQWVIEADGQPRLRLGLQASTDRNPVSPLAKTGSNYPPDTIATVAACLTAISESVAAPPGIVERRVSPSEGVVDILWGSAGPAHRPS